MDEQNSNPTDAGNVYSASQTWNALLTAEPEVQYRSTTNRLTLGSFQDILWNVCENYQNIISQLQTGKPTGSTGTTGVSQVVSLGRQWIDTGSMDPGAPSELLEEQQYEDFMGLIGAVGDAFKKHNSNAEKEFNAENSSSWQKKYFELYDLFIATMDLNGRLHRYLASARSDISVLRAEAKKENKVQQRNALELQPVKELASAMETNAKFCHELNSALEAKLNAEKDRDLVYSKLELILQDNRESKEVLLRLQEENNDLKKQLEIEKGKTNEQVTEIDSLKVKLDKRAEANGALERAKQLMSTSHEQIKEVTKQLNDKSCEISALQKTIEVKTTENAEWSKRYERLKDKLTEKGNKARAREDEIGRLRRELRRAQQGLCSECGNYPSVPGSHHESAYDHGRPYYPPMSGPIPSGQFAPDAGRDGWNYSARDSGRPIPTTHDYLPRLQ